MKKDKQLVVCKNFKLIKKLGTGAFGQIYLAQNKTKPQQKFAAKLQEVSSKFPQLHFQAKMYKYIHAFGDVKGIPKVYAFTTEGQYNIMLMDLLGKSLEDLFVQNNKQLSLKTVLMIGQQMIDRIQVLHQKQLIHRDIKPDNFLIGVGKNIDTLYIVDFGLSKKYIKDNKHIPYKQGKQLTGTARYASINTHMGIQQSRRDDIQSIGYVLLYLLRGILPWQNMKANDTKTKYKMIMEKKISTPAQILCKGFPQQFISYLNYAKNLKFQQKPDYNFLKSLFIKAKKSKGYQKQYRFDWSNKPKLEVKNLQVQTKTNFENQIKPITKLEKQPIYQKKVKQDQKKNINPSKDKRNSTTDVFKTKDRPVSLNQTTKIVNKNLMNKDFQLLQTLGTKIVGPKICVIKR